MASSTATIREPKQMDPSEVVEARAKEPVGVVVGIDGGGVVWGVS